MSAIIITALACLLIGTSLGYLVAAIVASGHHEDECRRCAVRDVESYGGTDS